MGLEFINISQEGEKEGVRANGTSGGRNMEGARRPHLAGQNISQTFIYENQRARRSEGPVPMLVQPQRKRQPGTENQRRRPRSEERRLEQRPERNSGPRPKRRPEQRLEQRPEGRIERRPEQRPERKIERRPGQRPEGRIEQRPEQRPERRIERRPGQRLERGIEQRPGRKPEHRTYSDNGNTGRRPRPRPADPKVQQERIRRRRIRRRKRIMARMTVLLILLVIIFFAGFSLYKLIANMTKKEEVEKAFNPTVQRREVIKANETEKPIIKEDFLTVNEYSRPGEKLNKVKNVFVHYTANPGTSAAQNRSYFENLGITGETSASAHFIIGYDGEIIQCIPLEEIAYAVMQRNYDSISIECCYLSEDGKFTDATYQSLLRLSAWLLKEYKLAPEDMRRHYDEGGKKCPLYYVEHEDAWEKFLTDLEQYIMNDQ